MNCVKAKQSHFNFLNTALSCLHLQTSGRVGSRPSRSRQDRHADACCQALTCTFVPFTFFMASGIAPCDFHTHLVRRSSTNLSDTLCARGWGEGAGCLLEVPCSASVPVPYRIPRVPRCVLLLPLPGPYGRRVRTINPLQAALSLVELLAVFLAFTLVNW